MRPIWTLPCVLILGIGLISCFDPPTYSPVPAIEYSSILFKEIGTTTDPDSLIVSVQFKDGDGDLGLDPSETDAPYNNKFYYQFPDGKYITYETKRTNPDYDTLPAFVTPYNCTNWEVFSQGGVVQDTLYFQLNPNHYNIFVKYFTKNPDGSFTEFKWREAFIYPNCAISFDGRFPILSKDQSHPSPLEGTIRYAMASIGFKALFSIKTLKLQIQIQDRVFNRSNVIETPEFTLQSIKGN